MSIKAASVTPVKKILIESDPSGETFVMVQPASYKHELLRGEYLKARKFNVGVDNYSEEPAVNRYQFDAMEIWVSYPDIDVPCSIDIELEDETISHPFKKRSEMTQTQFLAALGMLTYEVVKEWHKMVCEVNPGWGRPF